MDGMSQKLEQVQAEVNKVIKGKEDVVKKVLAAVIAGGHILMEDIPGVGKTTLATTFAKSMSMHYKRVQFTPDVLPSDILGFSMYNSATKEFEYREGAVFTNLFLADEINRTSPKTQSALLEAMQEKTVTVGNHTYELPKPYMVLATQNPIENEGTYPLPEAQLDRFCMQLKMGFPTVMEELDIMDRFIQDSPLERLEPVCTAAEIVQAQEGCRHIYVDESVRCYIAHIVEATRKHSDIALGVNPRGTLAYLRCCQAYAAIEARDFVTPDDVKKLCVPVLGHRIVAYRAEQKETILQSILEQVEVPTEYWKPQSEV
mgnify:CR=1 FL=1